MAKYGGLDRGVAIPVLAPEESLEARWWAGLSTQLMALAGDPEHAAVAIPQTDDELWTYVWETWGVQIPRTQICPGHVAQFTFFAHGFFAKSSVVVAQASRVHAYMREAWEFPNAPRQELLSDPTDTKTRFRNGACVEVLTASQKSARGAHPGRAIQDEADEMDLKIHEAAMGQAMPQRGMGGRIYPGCTVISSTHQHADGTFSAILQKAHEKNWPFFEYCYRETMHPHGWLSAATVEQKRNDMTSAQWRAEVEGQEPSPESRAIDPDAVRVVFCRDLGVYEGRLGEYIEQEPPRPDVLYAHGADWGKKADLTEIITIRYEVAPARETDHKRPTLREVMNCRVVAYECMARLPWPLMVQRLDARKQRYGGTSLHDETGLGSVIDDYMVEAAEGFVMVGRARQDLFSEFVSAIERGLLHAPWITRLEAEYRYCTVEDLYGTGHPPDGFVAGALAYRAARMQPTYSWEPIR